MGFSMSASPLKPLLLSGANEPLAGAGAGAGAGVRSKVQASRCVLAGINIILRGVYDKYC